MPGVVAGGVVLIRFSARYVIVIIIIIINSILFDCLGRSTLPTLKLPKIELLDP